MKLYAVSGGVEVSEGLFGIGKENGLPWGRIKEDMEAFRDLTSLERNPFGLEVDRDTQCLYNSFLIMGHNTWNSLPPLIRRSGFDRDRVAIVIDRDKTDGCLEFDADVESGELWHVYFTSDVDKLMDRIDAHCPDTVGFVIGGTKTYKLFQNKGLLSSVLFTKIVPTTSFSFDAYIKLKLNELVDSIPNAGPKENIHLEFWQAEMDMT